MERSALKALEWYAPRAATIDKKRGPGVKLKAKNKAKKS
jgi:hypothetical protein